MTAASFKNEMVGIKDRNVKTALQQIKEKKYPESLMQYSGNILLVGINYDKKTKVHQCAIEMMEF